jgi:hypothetical protein
MEDEDEVLIELAESLSSFIDLIGGLLLLALN